MELKWLVTHTIIFTFPEYTKNFYKRIRRMLTTKKKWAKAINNRSEKRNSKQPINLWKYVPALVFRKIQIKKQWNKVSTHTMGSDSPLGLKNSPFTETLAAWQPSIPSLRIFLRNRYLDQDSALSLKMTCKQWHVIWNKEAQHCLQTW